MRACRSASRPGRTTTRPPRRKIDAVHLHLGQPARGVAHVGGRLRRLARHRVAELHAAVQLEQLLGRDRRARARSSPSPPGPAARSRRAPRRSAPARAGRAPPRSRCCRRGCRGSRGRSAGGPAGRSPRRASRRPRARRAPARCSRCRRARRAARRSGRPSTRSTGWVEISEWRSASPALEPGSGTSVRFSTRNETSRRPPVERPHASSRGAHRHARRARSRRRPRSAAARPRGARRSAARKRTSARHLAVALDDALQLEVVVGAVERARVRGRVDDPERRRRGVLGRARRVRIERVALVEQRLDQLVHELQQLRHARVEGRQRRGAPSRAGAPASVRSWSGIQPLRG